MNDGYRVDDEDAFDEFGKKLNQLADNTKSTGDLVGGMVADPGLFGVLAGQIIGAAASSACDMTGQAFDKYSEAIQKHKDKLDKTLETYQAQEDDVATRLSEYKV
ncbi:hypothetical protein [Prauserella cavernicola]|uniref:ESX-1 secretion-associated protein n=1 Tax=Prauserella cavernicola TaxID=2800127 RepID=A0A934QRR5_9PSEU|nr:hypothetical protein [Prauserella cavernicola]MBK1785481.1 hypothetical protein [Prauserella cavernicola]